MTLIKISEDGKMGKRVNPFDGNYSPVQYDDFETVVPSYPITEPGEPNCEVEAELVDQLFSPIVGWVNKSEVTDFTKYIRKERQAWQISKLKVELPPTAEVIEQSIEEAALQYATARNSSTPDIVKLHFIAGANHILTSKGMVELDKVVEIIEERRAFWNNGAIIYANVELTYLLTKIKSLKK